MNKTRTLKQILTFLNKEQFTFISYLFTRENKGIKRCYIQHIYTLIYPMFVKGFEVVANDKNNERCM